MKSKAHYKKCVELGVVPVPTSVCDENVDKEAIARLVAGGGNADDSSDEEDDTEGEDSDESGSEEHEAAQSLLSLSQRSSNRLPGLLPAGRPTTYPYALTFPTTSVTTSIVSTCAGTAPMSITSTTVIQSELSHRYYFPSSRSSVVEEGRDSVIRCSKTDDSDVEVEEVAETESRQQSSQPMDLTTKQTLQPLPSPTQTSIIQRAKPTDILTPVSEPILMQTIVQTMERLPLQGREWKPDAEGHMLQAYLTERHVMDSKMKQQYRVGSTNRQQQVKDREGYPEPDLMNSRNIDSSSIPTVTYTDPSRLQQQSILETRIKCMSRQQAKDEIKMEIREKIYQNNGSIERRPFDIESLHIEKEIGNRLFLERENNAESRIVGLAGPRSNADHHPLSMTKNNLIERSSFNLDFPSRNTPGIDRKSPTNFAPDQNNRIFGPDQPTKNEIDRSSMFNAMKMMSETERPRDSINPDIPSTSHDKRARETSADSRIHPSHSPRHQENGTPISRPPSREIRAASQDYRAQPPQPLHESRSSSQEFKLPCQESRPPSQEFKSPHVDSRSSQDVVPVTPSCVVLDARHNITNEGRPPSRDMRIIPEYKSDHRPQDIPRQSFQVIQSMVHESPKMHELPRIQQSDARSTERLEIKRHEIEMTKQNIAESIKQTVARKMVVGGPGFRSPSPPGGSVKPQAEFLQPSSGPASNYVR